MFFAASSGRCGKPGGGPLARKIRVRELLDGTLDSGNAGVMNDDAGRDSVHLYSN